MTSVTWFLQQPFVGPAVLIAGGAVLAWVSAKSFLGAKAPVDLDAPGEPDDLDHAYADLAARQYDLDRVDRVNGSAPYKAWLREQIEAGCTFDSLFQPDRDRGAQ